MPSQGKSCSAGKIFLVIPPVVLVVVTVVLCFVVYKYNGGNFAYTLDDT